MALRPGKRFEMSSHFIPPPRSSMIRASSSGDHFDCLFAGESLATACEVAALLFERVGKLEVDAITAAVPEFDEIKDPRSDGPE